MKINMTTDYALRIIRTIYLAKDNVVTSKMISEKENISQGVIMKILKKLKDANIVESHQGRGENVGGFSLITKIEDLTLYDVLAAMEGPTSFTFPRDSQYYALYGAECGINQELYRVNRNLMQDMKKKSLYEVFIRNKKEAAV